jgi:hypothetical protein
MLDLHLGPGFAQFLKNGFQLEIEVPMTEHFIWSLEFVLDFDLT